MSKHIRIYEYKDDDTPIGHSIYFHEGDEVVKLPHLVSDWHWRIDEEECECDK